jgi:transposase-like protein
MKTMTNEFDSDDLNLISLAQEYSDDDTARQLLERLCWPNGAICPHCKNTGNAPKGVYPLTLTPKPNSKRPTRKGLYFCGACRKQFTVTVGTVFEGSHIPIGKWLMAMFIISSSKKAMSAHQLHRMLKITYKTAWFMCHRIRYAMGDNSTGKDKLSGVVEVDETYVGGKGDFKNRYRRQTPVVALVERGGNMRAQIVNNVTQKNLGKILNECVSKQATVNTDEHSAYRNPLKEWKQHNTVVHSKHEYSRRNADGTVSGINNCESFFSLLKRGVFGAWHSVSKEHLPKYVNEFAFRWNTRKDSDGKRMEKFAGMIEGKRLTYRQAI